jgi:hypothetical protein
MAYEECKGMSLLYVFDKVYMAKTWEKKIILWVIGDTCPWIIRSGGTGERLMVSRN